MSFIQTHSINPNLVKLCQAFDLRILLTGLGIELNRLGILLTGLSINIRWRY